MIHWSSLVAEDDGTIDYTRARSLVSIVLAVIGGAAAVWVIFLHREVNPVLVSIVVTALVLPLTGGKISDAIMQKAGAAATAKVVAGAAPDRRASGPTPPP